MAKFLVTICLLAVINSSTSSPTLLRSQVKDFFPWRLGKCLTNNYISMQDFDANKFFNGSWYELLSYGNNLFQEGGRCPSFQAAPTIDGKNIKEIWYQYEPILKKWVYLDAKTDLKKLSGSKFSVTFDFLAGLANIEIPASVVNTDYENYAVTYLCEEALGFKFEISAVYTRVRGDETHREQIKQSIEKAGLNYMDYSQTDLRDCGPDEPHL